MGRVGQDSCLRARKGMRRVGLALLSVLVLVLAACDADTESATNVSQTSATLRASVDRDDGEDVAYWFEYRRAGASAWIRDDLRDPGPLPGSGRGVVIEEPISGLTPGTTYEYRL